MSDAVFRGTTGVFWIVDISALVTKHQVKRGVSCGTKSSAAPMGFAVTGAFLLNRDLINNRRLDEN